MTPALVAPRTALAYHDTQRVVLSGQVTRLQAWNRIMSKPLPGMSLAFRLRDAISSRFGVAPISGFSGRPVQAVRRGDRLDFFLVEAARADQLVLTARDRHLDVMISVDCQPCSCGTALSLTASVVTHNRFGRLYMLPVAPAHRLIVWLFLRRLQRANLAAEPG